MIYKSFYIPFTLYKYHGLTSFSINKHKERLISGKIDILIQGLIVLFVTAWIVLSWMALTKLDEENVLQRLFHISVIILTTVGVFILFTTAFFRKEKFYEIFHQIDKFDEKLRKLLQVELFYRKTSTKKYILFRLLITFVLFVNDVTFALNLGMIGTQSMLFSMVTVCSSMYCTFIAECQRRVRFTNDYMEKMFHGNRFIACIEMKLTPMVNICYSLEDIKTELSVLIDTVDDINKYFEMQLFVKAVNMFLSLLWSSYYFIVNSGRNFDVILSLERDLRALFWPIMCVLDFCIDVHIYQSLLVEVSI